MSRTTYAATLALALLSLAAAEAAASPVKSAYDRTYNLQCSAGKTDGESLKTNQTIVRNTSGRVIPKGAKISIGLNNAFGRIHIVTVTAYRDVKVNETIPMGDSGAYGRCTATVTLSRSLPPAATKVVPR